jgi:hypothetical protein
VQAGDAGLRIQVEIAEAYDNTRGVTRGGGGNARDGQRNERQQILVHYELLGLEERHAAEAQTRRVPKN